MELTRLKKKLVTAVRGHKLLKDKRDELMRQFLDKVRENKALREEVETALVSANQNFMLARAGMPDEMLNTALLAPKQELTISAGTQNVMSVEIPDFDFKTRTPDHVFECLFDLIGKADEVDTRSAAGGAGNKLYAAAQTERA